MASAFLAPDVLVLAGGGVLGEAWMSGLLAGVEDAAGVDFRQTESFVGTSAGAIVSARLAAGRPPRRPRDGAGAGPYIGGDPERDGDASGLVGGALREAARWGWAATAPLAGAALAAGAPAGALARAAVLARAPAGGRRLDDLHASLERDGGRFDGRLRICCVDRATGRRVVFGAPGAPFASVADAVVASCSIPWVFAPVRIGGREYVDGGVWSVTNLDAAPALRATEVLCLDPTAGLARGEQGLGLIRQGLRAGVAVELAAVRRRGARVRHIGPDTTASRLMGSNLMDPGPADRVLAAGFAQGRALAG